MSTQSIHASEVEIGLKGWIHICLVVNLGRTVDHDNEISLFTVVVNAKLSLV